MVIIAIILGMTSQAVFAGKIYKWVDDKGQVHYSEQAPAKNKAEAIKVRKSKGPDVAVAGNIEDDWWFKLDELAIKVSFDTNTFVMKKWSAKNRITPLMKGEWSFSGARKMVLKVTSSQWEKFSPGKQWVWHFTNMQTNRATVITEKERRLSLVKQGSRRLKGLENNAEGRWHEVDRGFDLDLNEYGFTVDLGENARNYPAVGNWWFDDYDTALVLEYGLDGLNPNYEWMGRKQKWSILKLDERKFIIQRVGSSEIWRFSRQRTE